MAERWEEIQDQLEREVLGRDMNDVSDLGPVLDAACKRIAETERALVLARAVVSESVKAWGISDHEGLGPDDGDDVVALKAIDDVLAKRRAQEGSDG